MKRMRLKRRIYLFKNGNKSKILIIILLGIIICVWLSLRFINNKASPILFSYAELESKKLASIVINDAIAKNVTNDINIDELFLITKDSKNEIKTIDFNPITVNKMLTSVTSSIQKNLKYIENGKIELISLDEDLLIDYEIDKLRKGIICEIPTGVILGNSFLSNLGPKIPVKFNLDGDIISHVNTNITDYGINNAVIEININLDLSMQLILPFKSDKTSINTSIPVAIKLIQGSVPNYYLNGINQNSASLTLPIE